MGKKSDNWLRKAKDNSGFNIEDFEEKTGITVEQLKAYERGGACGVKKMLMNPHTGTVQSEEDWKADFTSMSSEEWGGENFEDADLVEVKKNDAGEWEEA